MTPEEQIAFDELAANTTPADIEPHAFVGRLDQWCTVCKLPDRNPIHILRPNPTPDCCAAWPQIFGNFQWSVVTGYSNLLSVPCLYTVGNRFKWRVVFCPSCGASVRDCVVERGRVADATF